MATTTIHHGKVISAEQWVNNKADQIYKERTEQEGDKDGDWYSALNSFEELCAELQSENFAWIQENEEDLIKKPGSSGKFVAVACRTKDKILAEEDDWLDVKRKALESTELRHIAVQAGLPLEVFLTIYFLDD